MCTRRSTRLLTPGITAPLMSSTIARTISVTVYAKTLPHSREFWSQLYEPAAYDDSTLRRVIRNTPVTFSSGAIAGASCSVFACPFEFTKLASQIELLVHRSRGGVPSELGRTGTLQVGRELYRKGGILALYGGFRYHIGK
jgi:hypothetical protein